MKVSKAAAVALWVEIGFKTAAKWTDEEMQAKFGKLLKMVEAEEANVTSKPNIELLAKVVETLKAEKKIVITADAPTAPAKEEKPAKKAKAAPAPEPDSDEDDEDSDEDDEDSDEDDEDSDEDDEDSDEDDEDETPAPKKKAVKEEAKPAKKAKAAPAPEPEDDEDDDEEEKPAKKEKKAFPKKASKTGPGVIASIVEFLTAASEEKPISKKRMVKKLAERFPDRSAESMAKTVNVQVPNRLAKDKEMSVIKTDKGYYIGEGKSKKAAAAGESKKASKKAAKAAPPADDDDEDDDE